MEPTVIYSHTPPNKTYSLRTENPFSANLYLVPLYLFLSTYNPLSHVSTD